MAGVKENLWVRHECSYKNKWISIQSPLMQVEICVHVRVCARARLSIRSLTIDIRLFASRCGLRDDTFCFNPLKE